MKLDLVLVEDDPMVMAVNDQFINQIGGFNIVGTAKTGTLAIELIQKLRPCLVILDIYLPDMDGVQVLQEIRRLGIPTDVIMITAAQDVVTVQGALRLGVVDYIIKPFKYDRIKAALEKYKAYLAKFEENGAIGQKDLDSLINNGSGGESRTIREEGMPKGIRDITLQQVINYMASVAKGLSSEEVAEGVGLARVTARRYLEYLERIKMVKLETQYGCVGRPINKYKLN